MNKVILMGNLGADAELRATQGGSILKFSLATTETWKNQAGEKQEKTNWHRCNLWGKRADALSQYLTKGTKLLVTGSIEYSSYEKDGEKRYATDIRVDNVEFAGGARNNGGSGDNSPPPESFGDSTPTNDADIPF